MALICDFRGEAWLGVGRRTTAVGLSLVTLGKGEIKGGQLPCVHPVLGASVTMVRLCPGDSEQYHSQHANAQHVMKQV